MHRIVITMSFMSFSKFTSTTWAVWLKVLECLHFIVQCPLCSECWWVKYYICLLLSLNFYGQPSGWLISFPSQVLVFSVSSHLLAKSNSVFTKHSHLSVLIHCMLIFTPQMSESNLSFLISIMLGLSLTEDATYFFVIFSFFI